LACPSAILERSIAQYSLPPTKIATILKSGIEKQINANASLLQYGSQRAFRYASGVVRDREQAVGERAKPDFVRSCAMTPEFAAQPAKFGHDIAVTKATEAAHQVLRISG
jgi:hypothetical protein